jgi:hypothetical protein
MFSFPRYGFSTAVTLRGRWCGTSPTRWMTSAIRLTKLITPRYVEIGPDGQVITGSGLRRITENE